jgi:hypothetical protein
MNTVKPSPLFLRADNPSFNLFVLSQMHREQKKTELCTEAIFKSLPSLDAYRLGLRNKAEAETDLGDAILAAGIALGALAIWAITSGSVIHCAANRPTFSDHDEMHHCYNKIGEWWTRPGPRICVAGGALVLGFAAYFHRTGWLGKGCLDSSASWRDAQMQLLYRNTILELEIQAGRAAQSDDAIAISAIEKTVRQILQNSDLIQNRLTHEVQLSPHAAEKIVADLRSACQKLLKKERPIDLTPLAYLEKSVDQRLKELVQSLKGKSFSERFNGRLAKILYPWHSSPTTWNLIPQEFSWRNKP